MSKGFVYKTGFIGNACYAIKKIGKFKLEVWTTYMTNGPNHLMPQLYATIRFDNNMAEMRIDYEDGGKDIFANPEDNFEELHDNVVNELFDNFILNNTDWF